MYPDGTVRLWNAESGEELGVLSGHDDEWVTAVAFSRYSRRIASGGKNGRIKATIFVNRDAWF